MHNRLCCASQGNRQQNKMNPIAFQMDVLSSHKLNLKREKEKNGRTKCIRLVLSYRYIIIIVEACVPVHFAYLIPYVHAYVLTQFIW